jgi:hypothetical protein
MEEVSRAEKMLRRYAGAMNAHNPSRTASFFTIDCMEEVSWQKGYRGRHDVNCG